MLSLLACPMLRICPSKTVQKGIWAALVTLTAFNASKPGSPLSSEASLTHCVFMTLVHAVEIHNETVPQRQLETTTSKFLVPLSSMFLVQNKRCKNAEQVLKKDMQRMEMIRLQSDKPIAVHQDIGESTLYNLRSTGSTDSHPNRLVLS